MTNAHAAMIHQNTHSRKWKWSELIALWTNKETDETMKRRPPILHGTISTEEDKLIRERCRPLLEAWGKECWPVMDVNKLVRSIYVLGVLDGMQCEKQKADRALTTL